jgi:anti-anti-sigma factor
MKLVTATQTCGRVPITVFQLEDRLHMGNIEELEQAAKGAYEAGARNIVIDMTKAPSITSAGMRSLIVIYKMLTDINDKTKHLKLVSPTPNVREVLDITGLTKFIEIYDTLDAAVASY